MSADVEPSSEVTGGLVTEKTFSDDTLLVILDKVKNYLTGCKEASTREIEH